MINSSLKMVGIQCSFKNFHYNDAHKEKFIQKVKHCTKGWKRLACISSCYTDKFACLSHIYYILFTAAASVVCYALHLHCYCSTFIKSTQLTKVYQNYILLANDF